ncbi:hypothetical protein [Vibrio vulnificus]|uniref:hypothetical protein n=1 Tax=Vibrio vulnificus TaxID=672 RepID=UPI00187D3DC5|nr:hypothetical protein [Vibrio vulnificus]
MTTQLIDLSGAIIAFGIVFFLAGGGKYVEQKVRKMKLENDEKELELECQKGKRQGVDQ